MRRATPRRIFFCLATLLSGLFLLGNIHQTFKSFTVNVINQDKLAEDVTENKTVIKQSNESVDGRKQELSASFPSALPWYMERGVIRPVELKGPQERKHSLFPEEAPGEDRIANQLMYLRHADSLPQNPTDSSSPLKKILMWNGLSSWGSVRPGRGEFLKQKCPVSTCALVTDKTQAEAADLVVFKDLFSKPSFKRSPNQLWMIFMLECPLHTQVFPQKGVFNWTATYRSDSTIVAPYESWQYYDQNIKTRPQQRNFAANKTKQVAWFVSNCGARNGRLKYAKELSKYISVDIYGACSNRTCPRSSSKCFSMLDHQYKFYLAFENSNCRDYITEKFFVNGLGHSVLPIVMGARPEDYDRAAPYKSYIHVEQFSGPRDLAQFLLELDKDDQKYNQYFQWKGTGEFINTRFFCRVCALLHQTQKRPSSVSFYQDINKWWRGEGVCSNKGWKRKDSEK